MQFLLGPSGPGGLSVERPSVAGRCACINSLNVATNKALCDAKSIPYVIENNAELQAWWISIRRAKRAVSVQESTKDLTYPVESRKHNP
jgi:hypothetical protein